MIFDKQIKALEFIKKNKDAIILQIVKEIEPELLEMNKDQLYNFGEDAEGKMLPPYSNFTVKIKKLKGQRFDHMTLKDTGDFYKGFGIKIGKKEFEINSKDKKTMELKMNYGDEILGLNEKNKQEMIDMIYPILLEKVKTMIYESGSAVIA